MGDVLGSAHLLCTTQQSVGSGNYFQTVTASARTPHRAAERRYCELFPDCHSLWSESGFPNRAEVFFQVPSAHDLVFTWLSRGGGGSMRNNFSVGIGNCFQTVNASARNRDSPNRAEVVFFQVPPARD